MAKANEPTTKFQPTEASDATTTTPVENEGQARLYRGQASFDHDLYKLEVSKFNRNRALPNSAPEFEEVEHVHHFHSIDSNGKKLMRSTAIAGHFHEMILVKPATATSPATYKCGPAVRQMPQVFIDDQRVGGLAGLQAALAQLKL